MLTIKESDLDVNNKINKSLKYDNSNHSNLSNSDEMIKDEILALSEIYSGNVEKINNREIKIIIKPYSINFNSNYPKCYIELLIKYSDNYPKTIPKITIINTYNFEKKELEEIKNKIDNILKEYTEKNEVMIHEVCQIIQKEVDLRASKFEPNLNISIISENNNSDDKNKSEEKQNINPKKNALENVIGAILENNVKDNNSDLQNQKDSYSDSNNSNNNFNEDDFELDINSDNNDSIKFSDNGNERISNISNTNISINNQINTSYSFPSRFHNEFIIECKLGQGGGGSVFKVKNIADKMYYAIKRIKLILPKNKNIKEVLSKVQGEEFVLARLQNRFIVRYYQSWIEDYQPGDYIDEENEDDEYEYFEEDEHFQNDNKNNNNKNNNNNNMKNNKFRKLSFEKKTSSEFDMSKTNNSFSIPNIVFESINNNSNKNKNKIKGNGIWDDDDDEEEEEEEKEKEIENDINIHKRRESKEEKLSRIKTIYIQMEYCEGKTLREAIDNKILSIEQKWKLITQILEGVRFIHSKGLIHRDLKPGNIFLDNNYNAKIGDFGLAKITKSKNQFEQNQIQKELINIGNNDLMTYAIGTKYYCSPEQEKITKYTNKSDIFSLGIIIFEMFYDFNSLMERDIVLRGIKDEQKYPNDFEDLCFNLKVPNVYKIVKMCTNHDPKERPSAEKLLNSKLIPYILDEKSVLHNFYNIIEDNPNFSSKFLEILIEKNLKNIYSNTYENKNIFFQKFEDSQYNQILHKKKVISPIYYYNIIENIEYKIKSIFHENNVCYKRLNEIEIFDYYNKFNFYDNGKLIKIDLNNEHNSIDYLINELMLTKSGEIMFCSQNIYRNLNRFINKFIDANLLKDLLPIKYYSDSLNSISYQTENNEMIIQYNDIYFFSLWGNIIEKNNILVDFDEKYVIDCFKIIFQIIKDIELNSKSIIIRINSSYIFDKIFQRFLGHKENIKQIQLKTLLEISKRFNTREGEISLEKLKELITNKKIDIPISRENLNELLSYMNINGDLNSIKKRFEKKEFSKEIKYLSKFLENSPFWLGKMDERKGNYFKNIKIDFSLIPNNLVYYSDFYFQVCFTNHKYTKLPFIEGGRIDNYFTNSNYGKDLRGFSFQIFLENLFLINQSKYKRFVDYTQFFYDVLIITNTDYSGYNNVMADLYEYLLKNDLKCEIIFKKQNEINFDTFFKVYKMKYIVVLIYEKNIEQGKFKFKIESFELKNNKFFIEKSEVLNFICPKKNEKK